MSFNSTNYQQNNLQYLQLLYIINRWWTIEEKLGGIEQLKRIIY
jgi:hypothetical protein